MATTPWATWMPFAIGWPIASNSKATIQMRGAVLSVPQSN
jgi:hypothetical protein